MLVHRIFAIGSDTKLPDTIGLLHSARATSAVAPSHCALIAQYAS
jgi:hypothetical protein